MTVPEISVDRLEAVLASGGALLDVRQADEYEAGHVGTAVLIPLNELPDRLDEVPVGRPLYVICRTGHGGGQRGGRDARLDGRRTPGRDRPGTRVSGADWIADARSLDALVDR